MRAACLTMVLLAALPMAAQGNAKLTPEVLYRRSKASVVTIVTFDSKQASLGQGSGFIVAKNRVVTNYHVLGGSSSATVIFSDGSLAVVKSVVAGSRPQDLVIVDAETGHLPPLALGDELALKVGETIYAIGAPKGLPESLSNGLVSAFREEQGQFLIQITAAIAPGSSGGPLLNGQGQVVGVTTSQLKDGGFGFAAPAGDVKHLLKVPLPVPVEVASLAKDSVETPEDQLSSVQALFKQKKYKEAREAFRELSASTQTSFEGQLLLCNIEENLANYRLAIQACDAAIQANPTNATAHELKALSLISTGEFGKAENPALRAVELSGDKDDKALLALIYYSEEKYSLVQSQLSDDSTDPLILMMLAGAAYHNEDWNTFRKYSDKVTAVQSSNGWQLYREGVSAERDLNFAGAEEIYRRCDADKNFIDPVCIVRVASVETRQGKVTSAKSDIDSALSHYPRNRSVLTEAIFINFLVGNSAEAQRLHDILGQLGHTASDDSTDCLYYYGINQSSLATAHCAAVLKSHDSQYGAWSNAGYVALDNGDFSSAVSDFVKAQQLFNDSKQKHTVTQQLDVEWGLILAEYCSGNINDAKSLYDDIQKSYPQFTSAASLQNLPLVWSENTKALIDQVAARFSGKDAPAESLPDLIERANRAFDGKSWGEAIKLYKKALQSDPHNVDIRTDLGVAYFNISDLEQAAIELRAALKDNPTNANSLLNLGIVYAQQGKTKEAIDALTKLVTLHPKYERRDEVLAFIDRLKSSKRD